MQVADAGQFRLKRRVIGRVECLAAGLDLGFFGRGCPNVLPVEIGQRHQPGGVLAWVERCARWVAVGVDHIAVEGRAHGGRAGQQPLVKPVNMPVGIRQFAPTRVQIAAHRVGQIGAGMRQAKHDRAVAAGDLYGGHAESSGMSREAARVISPSATICAARSRSGAR